MKRSVLLCVCAAILLFIGAFAAIDPTARFIQLSLNNQTNIVSDNGSMWTFNGVPFCTNCGTTITLNPTDNYVPYRVNSTTFGDGPFERVVNSPSTNATLHGDSMAVTLNGTDFAAFGITAGGNAFIQTTNGGNAIDFFNTVYAESVIPDVSDLRELGSLHASLGRWLHLVSLTNYAIAYDDASSTNYVWSSRSMDGPTVNLDLVSVTNNTLGPVSGWSFRTNKVQAYRIPSASWDDSQVPEAMVRVGATAPTLANFNGGPVQTLQFQNNRDDTIMATVQMTHRWKQGTDIHPHVHWCETAATGAGTNVVWQLTYAWTNLNCAYPAYTTLKITNSVTGTNWFSQLSDFPDISGTGLLVSSIFVFELRRLANTATADDYNQNVAFLGFDIHHQVDSPGSDSELTKSW